MSGVNRVQVVRTINAPPGVVYAAWTDPQQMNRWMGRIVEADVRVGGRYRIEISAGRAVFVNTGIYRVLEPGKRLAMTFRGGPRKTIDDPPTGPYANEILDVTLRPLDDKRTELTFIDSWDGEALDDTTANALTSAWDGWIGQLARLF